MTYIAYNIDTRVALFVLTLGGDKKSYSIVSTHPLGWPQREICLGSLSSTDSDPNITLKT